MKPNEAARLIGMFAAYWPNAKPFARETILLWSKELGDYELIDGMEAAETLGTMGRFMPSLAEFIDAIRDCRNHRAMREPTPALPEEVWPGKFCDLKTFLRDYPDYAERVKKLGWWKLTLAELEEVEPA